MKKLLYCLLIVLSTNASLLATPEEDLERDLTPYPRSLAIAMRAIGVGGDIYGEYRIEWKTHFDFWNSEQREEAGTLYIAVMKYFGVKLRELMRVKLDFIEFPATIKTEEYERIYNEYDTLMRNRNRIQKAYIDHEKEFLNESYGDAAAAAAAPAARHLGR